MQLIPKSEARHEPGSPQKKSYADNYEHLWSYSTGGLPASVRGNHEKVGQLCQDAHHWEKLPEGVLVAAVADGAGSATLGKVGAIVALKQL